MSVTFAVEGLDRLRAKLRRIVDAAEEGTDEALGRGAEMIAALAAQSAPRLSGDLADSYDHERESMGVWLAGTNRWYAHFVEFGTRHSSARPHLFPAFEQLRGRIVRDIYVSRLRARFRAIAS